LRQVGRTLASLALAKTQQGGTLRVRQREELRRALATAADFLGWGITGVGRADAMEEATGYVTELAKAGVEALAGDVADELASKKSEMTRLKGAAKTLQKLADDPEATYPVQMEYSHTARDGTEHLVTKTVSLDLEDSAGAQSAAQVVLKRMDAWERLRDQMQVQLKQRQRQVADLKNVISEFAAWSEGLVGEVLATLH